MAGYEIDKWAITAIEATRDATEPDDRKAQIQLRNYAYKDGFLYWVGCNEERT